MSLGRALMIVEKYFWEYYAAMSIANVFEQMACLVGIIHGHPTHPPVLVPRIFDLVAFHVNIGDVCTYGK